VLSFYHKQHRKYTALLHIVNHAVLLVVHISNILDKKASNTTNSICPPYLIYRMSQEEYARLRESVPYVKVYRYNPKHLYPKLNGYGDNGQRSLKL